MTVHDPHHDSLVLPSALSRRHFVVTSLATGFALAAQPVSAQTITTDRNGLSDGEVKIPVSDGEIPAYAAMPASGVPFPTVLVVQEIFGVHEHIKDVCRRFAKLGYLAVAPALYAREGDVSKLSNINEILTTVVSKVPEPQVASDLDATVAWAKSQGGDINRLGIIGFCRGGRNVWHYSTHNPNLKAGVAFYGTLVDKNDAAPRSSIDLAPEVKEPVLGLYGEADTGIPPDQVKQMEAALKAAGKTAEFHEYPGAPHGFVADYRPSYRKEAAEDAWAKMTAWFKKYGVLS